MKERTAYAKIVNYILREDEDCSRHIPLNTLDESIYYALDDGIILSKLILAIDPNAIDKRKINMKEILNTFEAKINIDLALEGAAKAGVKLTNIDARVFQNKQISLILATLWGIIKQWMSKSISQEKIPELKRLKESARDDLSRLSTE